MTQQAACGGKNECLARMEKELEWRKHRTDFTDLG
jgi:hypothetical protein